ncbi:S26 family signal peptidase [Vibrio parahaemolyticus]|uniref:S26 family signal peptidase n=2 Tax=Vibrio harveyi group TaxID=717610 RepID=A0A9Q3U9N7_VIBPH|nr:S26 family signal peptidase [Vibrio parahaemolyticus]EJO2025830.1 S26 family signal peptidase [Vibrio parahaemolyticus]MCC3803750.1 S26 family signal peptidase [Vibrio parahaemolyticus]CAH1598732.1 Peptidase_S26 domain-containing protein [Vibrio jasicida]CAH1601603.1 Peptidase_S26 domain-containing protein [Vibrio jasicida]
MINANLYKKKCNKNLGFQKPSLAKRLLSGVIVCGIGYLGMNAFKDRYTIMVDYTGYRCLDARFLLVDKYDKSHVPGDIVAIAGEGVPILPDEHRYIKLVAGVEGDVVSFDGEFVTSSTGFNWKAPLSGEYEAAKKKYNLGTEWALKKNEIFLIGDTPHSLDGRVVGPSNPDYIIGKAYVLF